VVFDHKSISIHESQLRVSSHQPEHDRILLVYSIDWKFFVLLSSDCNFFVLLSIDCNFFVLLSIDCNFFVLFSIDWKFFVLFSIDWVFDAFFISNAVHQPNRYRIFHITLVIFCAIDHPERCWVFDLTVSDDRIPFSAFNHLANYQLYRLLYVSSINNSEPQRNNKSERS
jgi:hypothetical protein